MSEENVQIVRHIVDAWARGDFGGGDGFHPDVEFDLVDWPEPAKAQGMDAMRRDVVVEYVDRTEALEAVGLPE